MGGAFYDKKSSKKVFYTLDLPGRCFTLSASTDRLRAKLAMENKATFKVGKTYYVRSIGDWDCVYSFKVVRRTLKTVWLESCHSQVTEVIDGKLVSVQKPQARRVEHYCGGPESCSPLGRYAMSPLLCADDDKPLETSYGTFR